MCNMLITCTFRLQLAFEASKSSIRSYCCFPWISTLMFYLVCYQHLSFSLSLKKQFNFLTDAAVLVLLDTFTVQMLLSEPLFLVNLGLAEHTWCWTASTALPEASCHCWDTQGAGGCPFIDAASATVPVTDCPCFPSKGPESSWHMQFTRLANHSLWDPAEHHAEEGFGAFQVNIKHFTEFKPPPMFFPVPAGSRSSF